MLTPGSGRNRDLEQKLDNIAVLLSSYKGDSDLDAVPNTSTTPRKKWTTSSSAQVKWSADRLPIQLHRSVSVEEADQLLLNFKSELSPYIPFVEIFQTTTASELYHEKPVLFAAILTVTSYRNLRRQELWLGRVLSYLADTVIVQGHKNLDLIQGILVLAQW